MAENLTISSAENMRNTSIVLLPAPDVYSLKYSIDNCLLTLADLRGSFSKLIANTTLQVGNFLIESQIKCRRWVFK